MRSKYLLTLLSIIPLHFAQAQGTPQKWGPAPAIFPAGARMAVMEGDPSKSEVYTVRLDLPEGYRIPPHFHPTDENITVIQGTFLVGMGDVIDPKQTMTLISGNFATAPALQHHFGIAKTRTVVQVHGMGPFQLTYVNSTDDPTRAGAGGR